MSLNKKLWGGAFVPILMLLLMTTNLQAQPITFAASEGDLSASVAFDTEGTDLVVTLTNTSEDDVLVPEDVLTAVFFDIAGDPDLGRGSAILADDSTILFATYSGSGNDVGGEWAYKSGLTGAPNGASQGISSSGLGLFGPGDLFGGSNLQGPEEPDGLQYGITSAGDNSSTGNTPVTGSYALIQYSVVFTLSGLPVGFDLENDISNVSFQYGTSLDDPNLPVPEPATMLLLGSGLIGLAGVSRKKLLKKS